jgi:hypothetical protein
MKSVDPTAFPSSVSRGLPHFARLSYFDRKGENAGQLEPVTARNARDRRDLGYEKAAEDVRGLK